MKARIVAADSLGVRSLAVHLEACGYSIGVDLGASIAPRRYGLPPHELELRELERALESARKLVEESHIIVVTHYHYDHYLRDDTELYRGKTLLVKDIRRDINRSQALRGYRFLVKSGLRDQADVRFADAAAFEFPGGLRIEFSEPAWHGEPGTRLGKVLMLRVTCEGGSFVYASDTQGPGSREALARLLEWKGADLLVISGPPTYFAGYKVSRDSVVEGLRNLERLALEAKPKTLLVDHHLLRDLRYEEALAPIRERASKSGVKVVTAAEYMGVEPRLLEARRKELWRASE